MSAIVVLGAQWGDEGKGKIVDILSSECDLCCRYNGGTNAGHTLWVSGVKYAFHLVPSGVLNPKVIGVVGNGVVVHIPSLFSEIDSLTKAGCNLTGRLVLSNRAHIVFDFHMDVDGLQEGARAEGSKIGTTRKGIGPTYADKAARTGIRLGDLLSFETFTAKFHTLASGYMIRFPTLRIDIDAELAKYRQYATALTPMIIDTVEYLDRAFTERKRVLVEGANAHMLDIDYGTYPFVTSSHPTIGGVFTGLGISPNKVGSVIGVIKAYTTRVGEGPFPTELLDATGDLIRKVGHEFGTTTGRPRRCGWLDLVVMKYSCVINGYTSLNLTKIDCLTGIPTLQVAVAYVIDGKEVTLFPATSEELSRATVVYRSYPGWTEDISTIRAFDQLPENCRNYIKMIEAFLGVPIKWIGVGGDRYAMINL
ncbi:adenylosuccinate synthetase [Pelomyxa schiedti]|nr:adenylosuccinate synthetase [Pelomyxa schiedti]